MVCGLPVCVGVCWCGTTRGQLSLSAVKSVENGKTLGPLSHSCPRYPIMPLTLQQLEGIRAECHADDVEISLAAMSLYSEEEARAYFESGGKVVPQSAAGAAGASSDELKQKGNGLLKEGNMRGAIEAYQAAIAAAGPAADVSAINSNLSMVLLKNGQPEESLLAADASVSSKPDWPKAHYRRGESLFALRRYDEASAAYKRALEVLAPAPDAEISRALSLAEEAAKGGVFMRQLLPGREIAVAPTTQEEGLIFGAAKQMQNFIYLVGDATTREVYVFDACWDPRGIASYAARQKVKIVAALPTHYHFDHAGGAVPPHLAAMVYGPFGGKRPGGGEPWLAGLHEMGREYGCKLYCHSAELSKLAEQCKLEESELTPLEQGSTMPLGNAGELEILHTPGHTRCSICICVKEANKGGACHSLYSGDTIFPGSCGRLDFPDSDKNTMFDSLIKLRALDDAVPVYPGHAYSGDSTTIGREKKNGLLREFSREVWVGLMG